MFETDTSFNGCVRFLICFKFSRGTANGDLIGFSLLHIRTAEYNDTVIQFRRKGKDRVSFCVRQDNLGSGSLIGCSDSNHALPGITEGLRHTGSAGADEGTAGNYNAAIGLSVHGTTHAPRTAKHLISESDDAYVPLGTI